MRHTIPEKLKSRCGESIAEVLVSIIVIAFGLLLLASMILSSQKMIQASKTNEQMMNSARSSLDSAMAASDGSGTTGTVIIQDSSGGSVNLSGTGTTTSGSVRIKKGSAASEGQNSIEFKGYTYTAPTAP